MLLIMILSRYGLLEKLIILYPNTFVNGLNYQLVLQRILLSKAKSALTFLLPSTKSANCQVVVRNVLKSSSNKDINSLLARTVMDSILNLTNDALQTDNKDRISL